MSNIARNNVHNNARNNARNIAQPDFAREFQQSINPAQAEFDRLVRLRLVQSTDERASQAIDRRIQFVELTRNIVGQSFK